MSNYICPCCGAKYEINAPGTYQCSCGKEFTITPAQTPKKNICPFCKSELHPEAVKCSHCGEWLSPNGAPKSGSLYILLAFFFGPFAEFYRGKLFSGMILILIEIGLIAVAAATPLGFILAGGFQLLYFIYACCEDVNPAPVTPGQKQKTAWGMVIIWSILALFVIAIAISAAYTILFYKP